MGSTGKIIALDIGTTNIKAALISTPSSTILTSRSCPLESLITGDRVEIDPHRLWSDVSRLLREVSDGIEVDGIGISTHRGSFVTCNRVTGEPLHNLITWADRRAESMCERYNNRVTTKAGKWLLWLLGKLVGSSHMVCLSTFKVTSANVHFRYLWVLEKVARVKEVLSKGRLVFATLDCWLVYKLTGQWRTEYSNAAATGLYDMWGMGWCGFMSLVFGHPRSPFPEVLPSDGCYGTTDLLPGNVPVCGVIADVQSSHLGTGVTDKLHLKVTMGTCVTCSLVTGGYIHPSAETIFPQLAWKWSGREPCYIAERMTARMEGWKIDLLVSSGLVDSLSVVDELANSVDDCPCFVSTSPIDHPREGIRGFQDRDTPAHLVRAVLEAHAFTVAYLIQEMREFYSSSPGVVIVDGGASRSTTVLQTMADVTGLEVVQASQPDGALMGAYMAATRGCGLEPGEEKQIRKVFVRSEGSESVRRRYELWRMYKSDLCF